MLAVVLPIRFPPAAAEAGTVAATAQSQVVEEAFLAGTVVGLSVARPAEEVDYSCLDFDRHCHEIAQSVTARQTTKLLAYAIPTATVHQDLMVFEPREGLWSSADNDSVLAQTRSITHFAKHDNPELGF